MKNTQSPSPKPGQLRRRLTSALLTLSLVAGALAMTAKPAEAATTVVGCFTSNDSRYRADGIPVWLQLYWAGQWHTIGYGVLDDYGTGGTACATFEIPWQYQNLYYRVAINTDIRTFGVYNWGETNYSYPGYGTAYLYGWMYSQPGAFAY